MNSIHPDDLQQFKDFIEGIKAQANTASANLNAEVAKNPSIAGDFGLIQDAFKADLLIEQNEEMLRKIENEIPISTDAPRVDLASKLLGLGDIEAGSGQSGVSPKGQELQQLTTELKASPPASTSAKAEPQVKAQAEPSKRQGSGTKPSAERIANMLIEEKLDAQGLRPRWKRIGGLATAAGLGAGITGVAIDGIQGDNQSLLDNALIQALGTGVLATGVGAGIGAYSGNNEYNRRIQNAQTDLTSKQVRARDIQNRSPGADMRIPLRNAADASNNLKQLRGQQSAFRGRGARRAVGVTAAGAAIANLVDSLGRDPEILEGNARLMEEEREKGMNIGGGLLVGAGLLAATADTTGYDYDGRMSSAIDDVMRPGYYYMDETGIPTSRNGSGYRSSKEKPSAPKAPKDMTSAARELLRRKGLL